MDLTPPPLEDLLEFPTRFTFRAMGVAEETLVERCAQVVLDVTGRSAESVDQRESAAGRYRSVHLTVWMDTADQIRAIFAGLRALQGVRLVL